MMAQLTEKDVSDSSVPLFAAACFYRLGRFEEAQSLAEQGEDGSLKRRLLMHLAQRREDEGAVEEYMNLLTDDVEERLSAAALYVRQGRFESAIEIYRDVLDKHPSFVALHFYAAVCYSRLEFYDVALESVDVYLAQHPDCICTSTLKACNLYKIEGREAALSVLETALSQTTAKVTPLTQHNQTVFQSGDNGRAVRFFKSSAQHELQCLQIWKSLAAALAEAETNLMLCYLKNGYLEEAEKLLDTFVPHSSIDYVAKGLAHMWLGQLRQSSKHLEEGQQCLQLVGSSEADCDTILGRQCMALRFLLSDQHKEARVYLESIQDYATDDTFRWNYAHCMAQCGDYQEAQKQFEAIQNEDFTYGTLLPIPRLDAGGSRAEESYAFFLGRCYVANGMAEEAWGLFLRLETAPFAMPLLEQIADDCYWTGAFRVAARAFDLLNRLDPSSSHWRGKRGAIVGAFRDVLAHVESVDCIDELLQILHEDDRSELDAIRDVIWKWSQEHIA